MLKVRGIAVWPKFQSFETDTKKHVQQIDLGAQVAAELEVQVMHLDMAVHSVSLTVCIVAHCALPEDLPVLINPFLGHVHYGEVQVGCAVLSKTKLGQKAST